MKSVLVLGVLAVAAAAGGGETARKYDPNWRSLDARPLPSWYNEAKFGIFVVWGPYSVPAYTDRGYAEWYWQKMLDRKSATWRFHERTYGKDFRYEQFAGMLTAELWDPNAWADLFARSGAKYVVTTANYHDGFCLWPSPYSRTARTDKWNSAVTGPKRDVLGELNRAGSKHGLKMGIYYSLYEWFHPLWLSDRKRYVAEHLHPQFKDVVTKYRPWFIFLDGEWAMDWRQWRSEELAAWLFGESPVRETVVTNDRWGHTRRRHGSVYSSEYGGGNFPPTHPWQEDRGIGHSYGYNRNETIADYNSARDLIVMLSKVCGNGGNLLLDVGPAADGRIPVIMQERLGQIGQWLAVNGEAIYGSTHSPFWPRKPPWGTCTAKPGRLFAHLWGQPAGQIVLPGLRNKPTAVYLLADAARKPVPARLTESGLAIEPPVRLPAEDVSIVVVEIEGEPVVDLTIRQAADGSIALPADAASLHGKSPVVESYEGVASIGYWSDPNDSVSWEFEVASAGRLEVWLDCSCAPGAEGGELVVSLGEQKLAVKTESTGAWARFARRKVGTVTIDKPGRCTLTVQPKARPRWKALGLRSVVLKPAGGGP